MARISPKSIDIAREWLATISLRHPTRSRQEMQHIIDIIEVALEIAIEASLRGDPA